MSIKEKLPEYLEKNKERFDDVVDKINHSRYGIFFTEGFLLCSVFDLLGVDLILESGTALGQSTEILGNYFSKTPVVSVDDNWYGVHEKTKERLKYLENVSLMVGDSKVILPDVVKNGVEYNRIGIFIDGPKGEGALNLAKNLYTKYSNIVCVGYHDMTLWNFNRLGFQQVGEFIEAKDTTTTNEKYSYLNKKILEIDEDARGWLPNGPGLMVQILENGEDKWWEK